MTGADGPLGTYEVYVNHRKKNKLQFFAGVLVRNCDLLPSSWLGEGGGEPHVGEGEGMELDVLEIPPSRVGDASCECGFRILKVELLIALACFYDYLLPNVSLRTIFDMLVSRTNAETRESYSVLFLGSGESGGVVKSRMIDNTSEMKEVLCGGLDYVLGLADGRDEGSCGKEEGEEEFTEKSRDLFPNCLCDETGLSAKAKGSQGDQQGEEELEERGEEDKGEKESNSSAEPNIEAAFKKFMMYRKRYIMYWNYCNSETKKSSAGNDRWSDLIARRLVGSMTFAYLKDNLYNNSSGGYCQAIANERALYVMLLGVYKPFRKSGIARKMVCDVLFERVLADQGLIEGRNTPKPIDPLDLPLCDNKSGKASVVLVHADYGAVEFFTKIGFRDDPVFAGAYEFILDSWDNSSLLVYFTEERTSVESRNLEDGMAQVREEKLKLYIREVSMMEHLVKKVDILSKQLGERNREVAVLHKLLKEEVAKRERLEEKLKLK
eukprot:Nk52_evm11s208 gene=Nk52_evmTU11s208